MPAGFLVDFPHAVLVWTKKWLSTWIYFSFPWENTWILSTVVVCFRHLSPGSWATGKWTPPGEWLSLFKWCWELEINVLIWKTFKLPISIIIYDALTIALFLTQFKTSLAETRRGDPLHCHTLGGWHVRFWYVHVDGWVQGQDRTFLDITAQLGQILACPGGPRKCYNNNCDILQALAFWKKTLVLIVFSRVPLYKYVTCWLITVRRRREVLSDAQLHTVPRHVCETCQWYWTVLVTRSLVDCM